MTCPACEGYGLVPFVEVSNQKPDAEIGPEDLWFAVCLCQRGRVLRETRNAGRETGYALWEVWAAQRQVDPARVCRLEQAFSTDELRAVGFGSVTSPQPNREAALLSAGRTRRAKL